MNKFDFYLVIYLRQPGHTKTHIFSTSDLILKGTFVRKVYILHYWLCKIVSLI